MLKITSDCYNKLLINETCLCERNFKSVINYFAKRQLFLWFFFVYFWLSIWNFGCSIFFSIILLIPKRLMQDSIFKIKTFLTKTFHLVSWTSGASWPANFCYLFSWFCGIITISTSFDPNFKSFAISYLKLTLGFSNY